MILKPCRLALIRNITEKDLYCYVEGIKSFADNIDLNSISKYGGKIKNANDALYCYMYPHYKSIEYARNYDFSEEYLINQSSKLPTNLATEASFYRVLGILQYDKVQLTPIAETLLLTKRIFVQEFALVILSKQWIWIDDNCQKNLLMALYELLKKDEKSLEYLNDAKVSQVNEFSRGLFKEVTGGEFVENQDSIDFSRYDILKNLLLLSGLLIEKKQKISLSKDYDKIYQQLKNKEDILTKPNRGDVDYYKYLGDLNNGIFEVICKENADDFYHLYPNLVKYCIGNNIIDSVDLKKKQFPLQQIFYGAPGTGKSYTVDIVCEKYKHYRTTFHPDSDYSTFVGCYKPTKEQGCNEAFSLFKLHELYKDFHESGQSRPIYRFIGKYAKSFMKLSQAEAQSIFESYTTQSVVEAEVPKALACIEGIDVIDECSITYDFTPQAFTKAYIEAWQSYAKGEHVYLVIEEINRGNCAQIFGDLFQLLDRNVQGFSSYPIKPDTDLSKYIATKGNLEVCGVVIKGKDVSSDINSGKVLVLPPNLYIWATMNTSDQSLFPIDSAFKRRWDWKFVKITEGYEKDENGKPVMVIGEDGKETKKKLGWKIKISDEKTQDWWLFIQKVNEIIASMTSSADKQLGYFFCKPDLDKTTISAETFVSKVIFYLWNDVFKDFGFEDASLFRYKVNDKEEKDLTFPDFYDEDGEKVDTIRLTDFVEKVMNWKKTKEDND